MKSASPLFPCTGGLCWFQGRTSSIRKGFLRKGQSGSWRSDLLLLEKFWVWKLALRCARANGYRIGWLRRIFFDLKSGFGFRDNVHLSGAMRNRYLAPGS